MDKMPLVTSAVRFAVITKCNEYLKWYEDAPDARELLEISKMPFIEHQTDIALFDVPCIVVVTKDFERTLDGRGVKLYRHDIEYELFEKFEDAIKCYLSQTENKLPNGQEVEMDAFGALRLKLRREELE